MNNNSIIFIGLDTHKENTEVAYSLDNRNKPIVHHGKIKTTKQGFEKLVRVFQSKYPKATLHFVYEAGPCGYWVYRLLTKMGHCCYIVAPSLIPKKPGNKIKTDKRDAIMLTELLKNGAIEPIYVPEPEDEAIRDLSRARERSMKDLNDDKYQLKAMLLRNNIGYQGTANWSLKHLRWLTEIILPHPAQQLVLQEAIHTVTERINRLKRLDNELLHHVNRYIRGQAQHN
jgi:transposase